MTEQKEEQKQEEVKLYAGKYKTVEELEEGYKQSLPVFQENESLKKKLNELNSVPENYFLPDEAPLPETELEVLKGIAKNSGLTQPQFEKLAKETSGRIQAHNNQIEEAKKSLGEEKLNIINDYIKKNYPDKIADVVLKNMLTNKEMLGAALQHREKLLNTTIPGANRINAGGYTVTQDDVVKVRNELESAPANKKPALQKKYLAILGEYGRQKKAG